MNYIDVNTVNLERGEYYLFEFGHADHIQYDNINTVDITEGIFNKTPEHMDSDSYRQYSSRYLAKFLVKYVENGKILPTFIFYDVLTVNNKIPILEEYDEGYEKRPRSYLQL